METQRLPDQSDLAAEPARGSLVEPTGSRPPRQRVSITALAIVLIVLVAAFGGVLAMRAHAAGGPNTQKPAGGSAAATLHDATFRISGQTSTSNGSSASYTVTLTGQGELTASPARAHLNLMATNHGQSGSIDGSSSLGTIEEIYDGTAIYTRTEPQGASTYGPWIQSTTDTAAALETFPYDSTGFLDYQHLGTYQVVGTETVDGVQARHIHVTAFKSVGYQYVTGEDLWLSQKTSLPVRVTLTESIPATSSSSIVTTSTLTLDFTAWNTGVTIALPASYISAQNGQPVPPVATPAQP